MPKKKIWAKGKVKKVLEDAEETHSKKTFLEKEEEEYVNVVDYEKKKYSKGLLESNWSRYDEFPDVDSNNDETETSKADDFNFLLEYASSEYSGFQFSFEKQWDAEDKSVFPKELFNLDLNILCSGLACLPFHERIGLDESELSAEDKIKFEKEAEKNKVEYERLLRKLEENSLERENFKSILEKKLEEELSLVDLKLSEGDENLKKEKNKESTSNSSESDIVKDNVKKEIEKNVKEIIETNNETVKKVQKIFFNKEDENLEEWLDSVLDD